MGTGVITSLATLIRVLVKHAKSKNHETFWFGIELAGTRSEILRLQCDSFRGKNLPILD
jgi:hypothetical protein